MKTALTLAILASAGPAMGNAPMGDTAAGAAEAVVHRTTLDDPTFGNRDCNQADVAEPFVVLDLADIVTFTEWFIGGDLRADFSQDGALDLLDINEFVLSFVNGCP